MNQNLAQGLSSFGNCVYFAIDSREEAASISQTYV